MSPLVLIDGDFSSQLNPQDRGLAYGDGLFETIRVVDGCPRYWQPHMQRLQRGCQRLQFSVDFAQLEQQLYQDTCKLLGQAGKQHIGTLKIVLTRGVGPRGYGFGNALTPTRMLLFSTANGNNDHYSEQGISLHHCQTRLARQPLLAGIKHLNRLEQVLARAEWGSEHQEGLLQDTEDAVIEGVSSNLFLFHDGQLKTPVLNQAGVEGVLRSRILAWAQQDNLKISIEPIDLEAVYEADHLFVCNSLNGVWPVRTFAGKVYKLGSFHPQLQQWLSEDSILSCGQFSI